METISCSRNHVDESIEARRNQQKRTGEKPVVSCPRGPDQVLRRRLLPACVEQQQLLPARNETSSSFPRAPDLLPARPRPTSRAQPPASRELSRRQSNRIPNLPQSGDHEPTPAAIVKLQAS